MRQRSRSIPRKIAKGAIKQFAAISEKESEQRGIAHFKGGETLDEHEKLEDLAKFASVLELNVFITTNGLEVAEKINVFERIRDSSDGNMRVTLSLNGSTPKIDALIRVKPEYHLRTVEAAVALASAGIPFDINYVVHQGNVLDIPDMVALAKRLGASQLNTLQLILAGQAANGKLKKADSRQLLRTLFEIYNGGDEKTRAIMAGSLPEMIKQMKNGKCEKECVAGYRGLLYIRPDGKVFPCPNTDGFPAGDIYSSSIEELMNAESLLEVRKLETGPGCKGDILSGNKEANSLGRAIEEEISGAPDFKKKESVFKKTSERSVRPKEPVIAGCIQKNF